MIVRLSGILADVAVGSVVLERDGIAREVLVPGFALGELAAMRGQAVTLHTVEFYEGNQASGQLIPRMLGFIHPEDKLFFARFVSVKGIGPRKALKALAEPVRKVASWIESGDVKALARLPGIGARAAELIVASLKGKMNDLALPASMDRAAAAPWSPDQRLAVEIMVTWGDARGEVERWLERARQLRPDLESPDDWVRAAYRVKAGVEG